MASNQPPRSALKRLAELERICEDLTGQVETLTAERNAFKVRYEDILLENIRLQEKMTEYRERLRRHEPI